MKRDRISMLSRTETDKTPLELLCHVRVKVLATAAEGREGDQKPHWHDADPCQITNVPAAVPSIPQVFYDDCKK